MTAKSKTSSDNQNEKKQEASWNFPKQTLEEALELPKAIEEKYAGNSITAEDLAKAIGYNKSEDWRFREILRSSNLYGILEGSGAKANVSITDIGNKIVAPTSPTERQAALMNAFLNVDLFKKVYEYYKGKKLPEDEFFKNMLTKNFDIQRDRIDVFVKVFQSNINFLKAFSTPAEKKDIGLNDNEGEIIQAQVKDKSQIREFLDTCFVIMPFGEWFDRYYEEIYVPAIKDAGYEPVRADSLFSTGSVMEQIWDQILKSKLLLADLTGKNPNVFYELGLSHAKGKPVVFISQNLDDVPFDLRHLRVIIFDVREPSWDIKLKKNITLYLKNIKNEPEKSIPQPFRSL